MFSSRASRAFLPTLNGVPLECGTPAVLVEAQLAEFKQNPAFANQQLDTVAKKPTVVEQQLAEVGGDREEVERLQKQIEELTADRAAVSQQVVAQLDRKSEEFDRKCEELKELKRNPPPAVNSGKIDSDQTGEIVNFLKELLPPDTKWPKKTLPALRKFLEAAFANLQQSQAVGKRVSKMGL